MKKNNLHLVAIMLLGMIGLNASAHDIEVANADGVVIYYNYSNNGTELEVTYRGTLPISYSNEYTGNVVIPDEVTYMDSTRKVTGIGGSAFYECSGLTSVTIGNSVTYIGRSAFEKCTGLTSVTIGNSVTSIGKYAFYGCSGLQKIIVKDIAVWCGIIFVDGSNPLKYAHHLYSDEDTEITKLVIPNGVTSIGDYAFDDCYGLTSVTIPNSVTSIGNYAFCSCYGLTSVTIPNSVTSIGYSAFFNCDALTSITIPNSVTIIGNSAFFCCSGLTSIVVKSGNTKYDSRDNCNAIIETASKTLIQGCQTTVIPNGVTSIGFSAFDDCYGLTSVTIPNSVTSIGMYAFLDCI